MAKEKDLAGQFWADSSSAELLGEGSLFEKRSLAGLPVTLARLASTFGRGNLV
jgi:hypothetical protein